MPNSANLLFSEPTPFDPAVANVWGSILNTNFSLIDSAIAGYLSLSVAGNSNVVLTSVVASADQARNARFNFTGALTGNIIVFWPNGLSRNFTVTNNTTGAHTLTLAVNNGGVPAGTTYVLSQGATGFFGSDGTNITILANTLPTGTSGHVVPYLDAQNTFSASQIIGFSGPAASAGLTTNNTSSTGYAYVAATNDAVSLRTITMGVFGSSYAGTIFGQSLANSAAIYTNANGGTMFIGTVGGNNMYFGTNNTIQMVCLGAGGVVIDGSVSGGGKGQGTLNATGLYVQGTQVQNAAFKFASNNTYGKVASMASNSTVINNFPQFVDTNGSLVDSALGPTSFFKVANNLSEGVASTMLANLGIKFATVNLGTPSPSSGLSGAHGLGVSPFLCVYYINNISNDLGYPVGRNVVVNFGGGSTGDGGSGSWDGTNAYFDVNVNGIKIHGGTITASKWVLYAACLVM